MQVKKDFINESNEQVVAYARANLPLYGKLVQTEGGFAYLKVDDRYIHDLYPRLSEKEHFEKPPYFRRENAPGAHVSVVYENEKVVLREVGTEYFFSINSVKKVHPKGVDYIILEVES